MSRHKVRLGGDRVHAHRLEVRGAAGPAGGATQPDGHGGGAGDVDDETPFDIGKRGAVIDGDWPGMPAQWSFRFLPDDLPLGEAVDTTLNGPYLRIEPEDEAALQAYLTERGVPFRRDDDLINQLACWPEGVESPA